MARVPPIARLLILLLALLLLATTHADAQTRDVAGRGILPASAASPAA
jgi:hypothetical protein